MSAEFAARVEEDRSSQVIWQLQQALEVSEAEARDFASVQITCPDPRGEGAQTSLAEFITSPHGEGKSDQILETARQARQLGADPEKAIGFALGVGAVVDKETGRLARVADVKKKNIR